MSDEEHLWVTAPIENPDYDLEAIKHCTYPEYIRANIETWGWGDVIAYESAETGQTYTHYQVLEHSQAFAAGLIELGPQIDLQMQDVVAVILGNVPEYVAIIFGIWEAGLVATPVNPASTEYEIKKQLDISRPKVIITSPKLLPIVRSIQLGNPTIKKIIIVETHGNESEAHEDCLNYFEMLNTDTTGVDFFNGSQMTEDNDLAIIPFSSGTSGHPKGVMLTHFALLSGTLRLCHPDICITRKFDGNTPQERQIALLPNFHIYGLLVNFAGAMIQGAQVVTMTAFSPALFIKTLREFKPTVLFLVPTLVSFIANVPSIQASDLEQVHCIVCGAASGGEALMKKVLEKAKNAVFMEGYGLTETAGAAIAGRTESIGSVGRPLPEIVVKVVDAITGRRHGPGHKGELWLKSPSLMKGYLNNEQATRDCIDDEGWFHTGDIGYYDETGSFFIVDRLKELIKVKGFQVSPSELEDLIRSHEKVADAAVIGIPDEMSGEVPRAYVVPKAGHDPELLVEEVIAFVQGRVSRYKHLQGGVQLVEQLPKGASGKILRNVLKEAYTSQNNDSFKKTGTKLYSLSSVKPSSSKFVA